MSTQETAELFADAEDFGLAGHLAAIEAMYREGVESMYRECLTYMAALENPWPSASVGASSETQEVPVTGRPPLPGMFAAAA